jgi:hypothetical protein
MKCNQAFEGDCFAAAKLETHASFKTEPTSSKPGAAEMEKPELPMPDQRGDPALHPASFTRFVLPFQYQVEGFLGPDTMHYAPRDLGDELGVAAIDRKAYFSVETAHVLHQRAARFRLTNAGQDFGVGRFHISPFGEAECAVQICAPEILLFEFAPQAEGEKSDTSAQAAPLRLGLLIVEAYFPHTDTGAPGLSLAGMQQFNELFRYVQPPFAGHAQKYASAAVLGALANENWPCKRSRWQCWLDLPIKTSAGLRRIIAPAPHKNALAPDDIFGARLFPFADSRAFVHTCAVVSDLELLTPHPEQRWCDTGPSSGAWIRFLNVDGWRADEKRSVRERITQPASAFEQAWAKPLTYMRWAHFGSLTGYTPHSAAMLGNWCFEPPTWQHFRTMYFDQSCLLLYLRAAMSACSVELAKITLDIAANKDVTQRLGVFEDQFARLVNLYYQPQISNQQQGMELYKIQRDALGIEAQFIELRTEIEATRHRHTNARAMRLTELGVFLALFATLSTAFDAFEFKDILGSFNLNPWPHFISSFTCVAGVCFILMRPILWLVKRKY